MSILDKIDQAKGNFQQSGTLLDKLDLLMEAEEKTFNVKLTMKEANLIWHALKAYETHSFGKQAISTITPLANKINKVGIDMEELKN